MDKVENKIAYLIRKYFPHAVVAGLAAISIVFPGATTGFFQAASRAFLNYFDYATLGVTTLCIVFCFFLVIGPWGRLRIGGQDAEIEFSTRSWLAMLFAAGMGSGLVFWGAAEPLIFTTSPPPGTVAANTPEAVRQGYALTMFHWAFHAWAIYAVSALAIGYVAYADNRVPLPSVVFTKMSSKFRRVIDWVVLFAVTFGIVASLGQGAINLGVGTEIITGEDGINGTSTKVTILIILLGIYLYSAWRGLQGGIEPLSNFNMGLAFVLAAFVLFAGPTLGLLQTVSQVAVAYGESFFQLSTELRMEGPPRDWTRIWSLTYFLWWVAWTPFVGVFIARISKGRTIRSFILGVVLVPSIVTLFWFAIFGGAALDLQQNAGVDLGISDFETAPAATYVLMDHLPWSKVTQTLTFVLIFTFLVTSADSGAYVLAMFSSGQKTDPPKGERMFWGVILAALTIGALLSETGQNATRALAVVGAIPLLFLMVAQGGVAGWRIFRDWRSQK